MKALIVNADDYAISPGVTRGILEAHHRGILTSTSFMVDTPCAADAARLAREAPHMSVGLHADLSDGIAADPSLCHNDLERQIDRFVALTGRAPTHLDSHHNVHRNATLAPVFAAVAARHAIPLRDASAARYFPKFYGQWSGRSHLEHIGVASLANMLEGELGEGLTELSCHPGYPDLDSGYHIEREVELRTLCDPRLPGVLERLGIRLVSYHEYARLLPIVAPGVKGQ